MNKILLFENLSRVVDTLPVKCAAVVVNFSKERFRRQNWMDKRPEPWPKRKPTGNRKKDSRAILVKSGRLRRSIRRTAITPNSFTIGTDVPYAKIHNDGGKFSGTERVRSHTRSRKNVKDGRSVYNVRSFTRKYERKLPRRQFVGQSLALEKRITRFIKKEFTGAFKRSI